jgi:hypothetical protein
MRSNRFSSISANKALMMSRRLRRDLRSDFSCRVIWLAPEQSSHAVSYRPRAAHRSLTRRRPNRTLETNSVFGTDAPVQDADKELLDVDAPIA